jgi:hypothetical protein
LQKSHNLVDINAAQAKHYVFADYEEAFGAGHSAQGEGRGILRKVRGRRQRMEFSRRFWIYGILPFLLKDRTKRYHVFRNPMGELSVNS